MRRTLTWWARKGYECVYLDFSEEFNTIFHNILLEKLAVHGLDRGSCLVGKNLPGWLSPESCPDATTTFSPQFSLILTLAKELFWTCLLLYLLVRAAYLLEIVSLHTLFLIPSLAALLWQ